MAANACSYCGYLDWTVEKYGRVTHKESCPMRTDPWHQRRTYADHLQDWEKARAAIDKARELLVPDEFGTVSFSDLAVWFHRNGGTVLDALENLLDASAFKDSAALRRQTEIIQRLGGNRA